MTPCSIDKTNWKWRALKLTAIVARVMCHLLATPYRVPYVMKENGWPIASDIPIFRGISHWTGSLCNWKVAREWSQWSNASRSQSICPRNFYGKLQTHTSPKNPGTVLQWSMNTNKGLCSCYTLSLEAWSTVLRKHGNDHYNNRVQSQRCYGLLFVLTDALGSFRNKDPISTVSALRSSDVVAAVARVEDRATCLHKLTAGRDDVAIRRWWRHFTSLS